GSTSLSVSSSRSRCSSSTSPRQGSTPAHGSSCGTRSTNSPGAEPRCSSPPSISMRPMLWPTGSVCSIMGAWRGWELRRNSRPGSERTLWPSAPPMAVTWPILPRTARSAVSPRRWSHGSKNCPRPPCHCTVPASTMSSSPSPRRLRLTEPSPAAVSIRPPRANRHFNACQRGHHHVSQPPDRHPRRCLPHLHLRDLAALSPRRPPRRFDRRQPPHIPTPPRELPTQTDTPPTAAAHPASPPVAAPVSPPSVRNIRTRPQGLSAEAIFIGRSLRHALRDVESLLMAVALPVLLMLMFTFVFGGALDPDGGYVDYVVPGIVLTCAGFGAASTSLSVATDMTSGFVDRLRTMPVHASAVITGHVTASLVKNLFATAIVILVAVTIGFRPSAGFGDWLMAIGLVALYILAITYL